MCTVYTITLTYIDTGRYLELCTCTAQTLLCLLFFWLNLPVYYPFASNYKVFGLVSMLTVCCTFEGFASYYEVFELVSKVIVCLHPWRIRQLLRSVWVGLQGDRFLEGFGSYYEVSVFVSEMSCCMMIWGAGAERWETWVLRLLFRLSPLSKRLSWKNYKF